MESQSPNKDKYICETSYLREILGMAQVKNYGLIGAGSELQFGKQGPKLKGNADTDTFQITTEGGSTLTTLEAANGTSA